MFKDLATRVFVYHLAAYAAAVLICAAVNLWLSPDKLWFVWVLFGWGIGVAAHGLALLLRRTHRPERIFVDPKARAFTVHLFAYVAVIILLFVVNLTVTPQKWWFYWVALGWGAGVLAHGLAVFARRRRGDAGARAPRRRLRRARGEPLMEIVGEPMPPKSKRKPAPQKKQTMPRKKPAASRKPKS